MHRLSKNLLLVVLNRQQCRLMTTRLLEVGKLANPKLQGKYETGQFFIHSVFAYRGVILFPWIGKVYDRDVSKEANKPISNTGQEQRTVKQNVKDLKCEVRTYYQVLIDERDTPHIRVGADSSVTFLSNQDSTSGALYAIPGLDYVAHEDILPYHPSDKQPLQNHLFEKFLSYDSSVRSYMAKDTLREWHAKDHPWLELTEVHRETTENIRVTVMPFYIGCKEVELVQVYWWRYCVRLENLGDEKVQLTHRHWSIFSLSGTLETVRGRGIIGQEPVFSKQEPSFQYTSHVSLQAPSGHMWGTFTMRREDQTTFECRIPPFSLESKQEDNTPHGFVV